jgi:hypothetical protein
MVSTAGSSLVEWPVATQAIRGGDQDFRCLGAPEPYGNPCLHGTESGQLPDSSDPTGLPTVMVGWWYSHSPGLASRRT